VLWQRKQGSSGQEHIREGFLEEVMPALVLIGEWEEERPSRQKEGPHRGQEVRAEEQLEALDSSEWLEQNGEEGAARQERQAGLSHTSGPAWHSRTILPTHT
jgi:hypothetical protein